VVSKDALADAVWPQQFLSESVITRAIAGLRRALGDDAKEPRFIETIAKRGYRLLVPAAAAVAVVPSPALLPPSGLSPAGSLPSPLPHTPYTAGQWVRGERFFGRAAEIAEILHGPRNGIWLLGARAMGKTSLLKHLEALTDAPNPSDTPGVPYFPLFWDLQGSASPAELHADFGAALADAEERLERFGLRLADLADPDLFVSLGRLRRALRASGRTLLLLWDEAEELLQLSAGAPELLRKLRRALQSQEGIRTVMASGPRLWQLAELRDDTSPFLHGFAPPLYLGLLDDESARSLVRRGGLGEGTPASGIADAILRSAGGHPALLQLLSARAAELGDLGRATESVAADPTLRLLFAVDFDLLAPSEREILLALAHGEPSETRDDNASEIQHLEKLGFVRRSPSGLAVASPLRQRWLVERLIERRAEAQKA
jgi:hypothetical protein